MAYRINLLSLVIICLLCSGCYESKYPLASSDASRIDARLLKTWIEEPQSPGDKPYKVAIFKFSEKEYFAAFCNDNDNGTATITRAFTTMIDSVAVLNMQGIASEKPSDRTFIFFKYAFSPDGSLQTWLINRESPLLENTQFSSQAAFAAYIKKHIHDGRLFSELRRFKSANNASLKILP